MSIKILDKKTAEQIAAGEVIENPASVVKELVENALDAGSTRIEVEISGGGKNSITVTDNGQGISEKDLALAFKRFATSKLSVLDDLSRLSSLGFRGEALPSIAAVSRVKLVTRTKDALAGSLIELAGGEVINREEVGAPFGTRVELTDLFYNTPGRLKFLRADAAESARISNFLSEIALAYPEVAFKLTSGSKALFNSSGDNVLLHVIGSIYGNSAAESMVEISRNDISSGFHLIGFTSSPYLTRSSRRWITVVINGRLVKNQMIVNALERGYGDYLPRQRHPLAVLKLRIPQHLLDVNVHPAKIEIRFQNPEVLHKFTYETVRMALHENQDQRTGWPLKHEQADHLNRQLGYESIIINDRFASNQRFDYQTFPDHHNAYFSEPAVSTGLPEESLGKGCRLIGQYLHSYLVVQKEDDLLLIDQHAAHERMIYQQLLGQVSSADNDQQSQLILPLTVELPAAWRSRMPSLLPSLKQSGFDIDRIGEDSYIVRSVPFVLKGDISSNFITDILEDIIRTPEEQIENEHDTILKTIACHRAVKAGQALSREEMENLLSKWQETERAQYCPHGRPTVISFNRSQLEKSFHRKGI